MKKSALFTIPISCIILTLITLQTGFVSQALAFPITSPVTFLNHMIGGTVTYRFVGYFTNLASRVKPAPDVILEAKNIFTGDTKTTKTDTNGEYAFGLSDGFYEITVLSASESDVFVPPLRLVHVRKDKTNVNFKAFILP